PAKHRKAQVIANRQPQLAPGQIRRDRNLSGTIVARLTIALAACKIDVEHMDLVVARDDLAALVNEKGAIRGLLRRELDRERADVQINTKPARKVTQSRKRRIAFFGC